MEIRMVDESMIVLPQNLMEIPVEEFLYYNKIFALSMQGKLIPKDSDAHVQIFSVGRDDAGEITINTSTTSENLISNALRAVALDIGIEDNYGKVQSVLFRIMLVRPCYKYEELNEFFHEEKHGMRIYSGLLAALGKTKIDTRGQINPQKLREEVIEFSRISDL